MEKLIEGISASPEAKKIAEAVKAAVPEAADVIDAVLPEEAGAEPETRIEKKDGTVVISPVGRLDTVMSAELREKIDAFDTSDADLELDFQHVDYISSAGLRLLVTLQKKAVAGGHSMVLRNTNAVVNEVFRVSGFNKTFKVL